MDTQELHRGRLIDHIQLVVRDIEVSRRFYKAVFAVLEIPIGGDAKDFEYYMKALDSSGKEVFEELKKLEPMQKADFAGLFKEMHGSPVTIRTLDLNKDSFTPATATT